jgi:hypothetical protein
MKIIQHLFFIFLLLSSSLAFGQKIKSLEIGALVKAKFEGQKIKATLVCIATLLSSEDADANAIMNLNELLMEAEKEPQLLDVNFTISDAPLKKSLLVFGIETEYPQNLTLELFSEESYAIVANCTFPIESGNNFNAVDLSALDNGSYLLRLKDNDGKELNRSIFIKRP